MEARIDEYVTRTVVVTPQQRLDAFSAPALRAQLDGLLAHGGSRFVVDLSDVPFLDSAGMAVLVSLLKRARQAGGDVRLVWPKVEAAQRILRLTKFDRVFDMHDTAQAALSSF
jgi:anti-sigma B factor antagonist